MRLSDLIEGLPITATSGTAPAVSGLSHDSRRVGPGDLFVAVVGDRFDGRVFAPDAVARGAVGVIGQGPAPAGLEAVWLETPDPRAVLGPLAARIFDHPDRQLTMVGVTGTNGKSTVVDLVATILDQAGRPAARLGTLGYRFRGRSFAGERTTPEAPTLYRVLRSVRDEGAAAVAMEVSSHALVLGRVGGLSFDVAAFTNLTRDHFDFHRDFEEYFAAKRRLFDQLKSTGRAVVNVGDPYGRRLARELPGVLTFGADAEVSAGQVELTYEGMRGRIGTPRGGIELRTSLLGRFNLENVLAAVAVAEALELAPDAIEAGLAAASPLLGRLEPVDRGQPFAALIDYAHTDAALAAALSAARELGPRRLILVFGCGGDRDPGKRVLMGRVAGRLADLAVATSDNPRGEDPKAILAAVAQGLAESGSKGYEVVADRRQAIRRAVAAAEAGDLVLVAGKGHEEVQSIGGRELPFSDRQELTLALEDRYGGGNRG